MFLRLSLLGSLLHILIYPISWLIVKVEIIVMLGGAVLFKSKVVTFLTLSLLCIVMLMLVNFSGLVYMLSPSYYETVTADVTWRGNDTLFGVFPSARVKYSYSGEEHEKRVTLWNDWLFFDSGISEDTIEVKVNTKSPEDILYVRNLFGGVVNYVLIAGAVICAVIMCREFGVFVSGIAGRNSVRRRRSWLRKRRDNVGEG